MNNWQLKKLIGLDSLKLVFIISLFALVALISQSVNAAQLIDTLPAKLEKNWTFCLNFQSSQPTCKTAQIPLPEKTLKQPVINQTYEKQVILSSEFREDVLGILLPQIDDTAEIYFNDHLIGQAGHFLPTFESAFRHQHYYLIPSKIINYNQFNHIKIISTSSRNLPSIHSNAPSIENFFTIQQKVEKQNHILIITASILFLLAFFQLFYFFIIKGNQQSIYFSAFLISLAIVSITRTQYILSTGLNLSDVYKLEIFSMMIGISCFLFFLIHFFKARIKSIYSFALIILAFFSTLIILWYNSFTLRLVSEISLCVLVIISFYVGFKILSRSFIKADNYTLPLILISGLIWLSLLLDTISLSSALLNTSLPVSSTFLPISVTIASILLALTINHKYWQFFKGSTFDPITGSLLRPTFNHRLFEEMQRNKPFHSSLMVAIVDIQDAQRLSSSYQYGANNQVLILVSSLLTRILKPYDLVCKFDEEQFCIAVSISNKENAEEYLESIQNEMKSIQLKDEELNLLIEGKIGAVIYNASQHLSVSQLIYDANFALSKAKNQNLKYSLLTQTPTTLI